MNKDTIAIMAASILAGYYAAGLNNELTEETLIEWSIEAARSIAKKVTLRHSHES